MEVLAFDFGALAEKALHIFYVALGLGLVIFFHELGHFAVAKWCGVFVERFSIGFGPILWSFKRGDTEYALSLIPFGGYVKMLGQDDMDPSQLTSEQIAEDPRSYSAKNVPQRMAIISAGVIMNIITGLLFFAFAFQFGVETSPSQIGNVITGMPAWEEGAQRGDTFTNINGREAETFADILRGTTLSRGEIKIKGNHLDGTTFEYTIAPDESGLRRMIGVSEAREPKLTKFGMAETKLPYFPGTPAAKAEPAFQDEDELLEFNGTKIKHVPHLQFIMAQQRDKEAKFLVKRKDGKQETITVPARPFQGIGIWADIDDIAAIRKGSPAAKAGLKKGDKLVEVEGKKVGPELNPLFLPEVFEALSGKEISIKVRRKVDGSPTPEDVLLTITPDDTPAWLEHPMSKSNPLSIPSIGAAYHLTASILKVEPNSPAARAHVPEGVALTAIKIESTNKQLNEMTKGEPLELKFADSEKKNMAFAMWHIQQTPDAKVTLAIKEGNNEKTYELTPEPVAGHFSPKRGIVLGPLSHTMKGDGFGDSFVMGVNHTRNTAIDIYLTIRNLFTGELSPKNLHGPVGIAKVAFEVSQQGLPKLLLFLGFLSINLAVLNFLPIPVLDGGHMVFLIWEGVTRKRPSEGVLVFATWIGMAFVLGLMLFVIYLDIFVHRGG